jgi:hypothetical protein
MSDDLKKGSTNPTKEQAREATKVGQEIGDNAVTFAKESGYSRAEADREAEGQLEKRLGKPFIGANPNRLYYTGAVAVKNKLDRHFGGK